MKTFLLAALLAAIAFAPTTARAQTTSSRASGPTLSASRVGLSAPIIAAPHMSGADLMQEGGRGHAPGVSLIVVGAIGMLVGLLAHNGDILLLGTVVTTVGLVIYLF
jgi:hypothetical protein